MHRTAALCVVSAASVIVFAGAPTAAAQTSTYTYQGELRSGGLPANGSFDFNLALFPSEDGGLAITTDVVTGVTVDNGLFTLEFELDDAGLTPGTDRWLQVLVRPTSDTGTFTPLNPRQRLTRAPFATHSRQADTSLIADFADQTGATLQDVFDNDNTLLVPSDMANGGLLVRQENLSTSSVRIFESTNSTDGLFLLGSQPPNGTDAWFFRTDAGAGTNALKVAYNTSGFDGLRYTGGANESLLTVRGSSLFEIDTDDASTDDRAILPTASISPAETLAEAGVASALSSIGSVTINATSLSAPDIILSRTLSVPTDGYVLVIATAEVTMVKATNTIASSTFGVSDTTGAVPANQDIEWHLNAPLPDVGYDLPVTVHGLFQVSPGSRTFYFVGTQSSGNVLTSVFDAQLTCVFIPTAYGLVTPTISTGTNSDEGPIAPGLTQPELDAEVLQSILANQARIEAENAEMRRRIQALEAAEPAMIKSR